MFDKPFSHWLSYGATDQQTITELRGRYDGLVVPGTVAAFQHQGTGGFILTLSATVERAPYAIDPRFPLFQQELPAPKKSHTALAEILGAPDLVRADRPIPADFDDDLIRRVAENWVGFNEAYQGSAGAKFDKYARRLGDALKIGDADDPAYILAPYVVAKGVEDEWWEISNRLFNATVEKARTITVIRVVAASDVRVLDELLSDCADENLIIWVSDLNAIDADSVELAGYLKTISNASIRGQRPFALYGGFFSVVAGAVGLVGSAHGIGFGEYRAWPELPRSGPPPARFYLRQLHRYISQEDAQRLWMVDRALAGCDCGQCGDRAPIELEYHDLMKHSVECRAAEISEYGDLALDEILLVLESELSDFLERLSSDDVGSFLWNRMSRSTRHMNEWISAIQLFNS